MHPRWTASPTAAPEGAIPALGRLYLWAAQRLYYELAWSYDLVAWLVSAGRWDRWRRMALDYVQQQPLLELGFGTGALLASMADLGWQATGVDLSPAMQRQAAARLRRRGLALPRIQGRAQQLPLAEATFGTVVATFPSEYVVDPASLREIRRVLKPGGRLIVVGLFVSLDLDCPAWSRLSRWAAGPGLDSPLSRLDRQAAAAGLSTQVVWRNDPPWQVPIALAEKPL